MNNDRCNNLYAHIEPMTPDECKNGGKRLSINYSFASTVFGEILMASTTKGVCCLWFVDRSREVLSLLRQKFPKAQLTPMVDTIQQNALTMFTPDWSNLAPISLHVSGTSFQLKVWETLLKIPIGKLTTYGDIARKIGYSEAYRAVGTAVGNNPVAYIIPCHRVICSTGEIGNYHWGKSIKVAMIDYEAVNKKIE